MVAKKVFLTAVPASPLRAWSITAIMTGFNAVQHAPDSRKRPEGHIGPCADQQMIVMPER
jgi:hypothetical protein